MKKWTTRLWLAWHILRGRSVGYRMHVSPEGIRSLDDAR